MKEAVTDVPKKTLASEIFDLSGDKPKLLPEVRKAMLEQAAHYSKWVKIKRVLLIGSILTKQWKKDTDLDVTLIVEPKSEEAFKAAREYSAANQDKIMLPGTEHPINVFVRDDWSDDLADQIYDLLGDKWLKQTSVSPANVEDYAEMFQKFVSEIDLDKGELYRDLIDYNELSEFTADDIKGLHTKIQKKVEEINQQVKELAGKYRTVHALRQIVFSEPMTPEEIKKFQVRNKMPANVLYKLLERYHYTKFLRAIVMALKKAKGDIDTAPEVKDIKNIMNVEQAIDWLSGNEQGDASLDQVLRELTTTTAVASYDVPLGQRPQGRCKQKKLRGILTYENKQDENATARIT